jgi:hypothetical protein
MAYADRIAAWQALLASHRTNNATLTTTMATVSANTISAQNITDINAAIAAIAVAVSTAGALLTRPDSQPF